MKLNNKQPLSITHPHLVREWHVDKNNVLTPDMVTKGMGRKVWWKCTKGHEWPAYIYSRAGKSASGCPQCAKEKFRLRKKNERPPVKKSLGHLYPNLAAEWHPEKNSERGPNEYLPGSNAKVWWKCKKGHEWPAVISDRKKNGCPYCSGQRVSKENSFGSKSPHLVKEWHPIKNGDLTPYDVMPSAHKKAWFICSEGHEWPAYLFNRSKGKGCPYCSGHKATDKTSLLGVNPGLCKEWNIEKNGDKHPNQFKPQSNEKVWWKCSKGHEWEAVISSRHTGRGCSECLQNSKTSFPEQAIFYYIKTIFPDAENRKKLHFLKNNAEADIYVPSLKLAIEYDGYHHFKEPERDERKNAVMQENDVQLLRVRQVVGERKLPFLEAYGSATIEHDYNAKYGLDTCIHAIFSYINTHYKIVCSNMNIDSNKHRGDIIKQLNENERNLEALFPYLVEEWDFEKNETLRPSQVSPFSHTKVWWKCRKHKSHVWDATIANRANGRKCPYCLNRRINDSNSLFTLSPQMGKQWHPTKNGYLTPHQVALNFSKKVWWLCENGHEWLESPNSRVTKKKWTCTDCKKEGLVE